MFNLPVAYFDEAEERFASASHTLDIRDIRLLGKLGMGTGHPKLAWAASSVGLERGGPDEAFFLLLRADAMPPERSGRYLVVAAAAAELARFHRQADIVERAVRITRNPLGGESICVTLEQARDVIRQELVSPLFPSQFGPIPDYSALLPCGACDCPDCRRARAGENYDPFDDDGPIGDDLDAHMKKAFDREVLPKIPPEIADDLFEILRDSFQAGQSPEEFIKQLLGGGGEKKKGRKKR